MSLECPLRLLLFFQSQHIMIDLQNLSAEVNCVLRHATLGMPRPKRNGRAGAGDSSLPWQYTHTIPIVLKLNRQSHSAGYAHYFTFDWPVIDSEG